MAEREADKDRALDVYLEEYKSLRAEVLARVQTQNQAFNFLFLIMGATITAVIAAANSAISAEPPQPAHLESVINGVALLLPLVTAPLGFIFFDNEIMIHAIGSYLYYGDGGALVHSKTGNAKVFGGVMSFEYLPRKTNTLHHQVSSSRWLLFLVPIVLPILWLCGRMVERWDWWSSYSLTTIIFGSFIFLLDIIAFFLWIKAMVWISRNKKKQNKLFEKHKKTDNGICNHILVDPAVSSENSNTLCSTS